MITLKNRQNAPPNGFWVNVPQAKFNQQFWDFDSAVSALVNLMNKNPGLHQRFPQLPHDRASAEAFVDNQNALRVAGIRGADSFIMEGAPASALPFQQAPLRQWGGGQNAAGRSSQPPGWFAQLGRLGTGAKTLADWLMDGPVAPELSEQRAGVCVGADGSGRCPQNKDGDILSFFTAPAANLIRRQMEEKNAMKLGTSHDTDLGVCAACGCPLQTKVHVKKETIMRHMPGNDLAKLDSRCWITKEP